MRSNKLCDRLVLVTRASFRNSTTKRVFCVWVGDLFDPPQLPEEGQQPIDVADNLPESTRVTEVLVPVGGDLWAVQ